MNDYNFGNFVCMLRERKGLTQADIAQQLGVTPAAVSKWENGSSKPRVEVLFQLAEILDVRPEELMSGKFLQQTALDPDAVAQINQRYEYLRRIDACSTASVKFRRLLAWIIDWNIVGLPMLIILSIAVSLMEEAYQRAETSAVLITLGIILLYPICFILRDFIMNGRSLGKRITGLVIIDTITGEKAKVGQRIVRNVFLMIMQVDVIVMLVSGYSIGDKVAHTAVIPKKSLYPSHNQAIAEEINDYAKPRKRNTGKIVIIITSAIFAAIVLFFVFVFTVTTKMIESQKQTEQYKLAYTYFAESELFKKTKKNEDSIRLSAYSSYSSTDKNGKPYKSIEYEFTIDLMHSANVTCHYEDGKWYVCQDCTKFK